MGYLRFRTSCLEGPLYVYVVEYICKVGKGKYFGGIVLKLPSQQTLICHFIQGVCLSCNSS